MGNVILPVLNEAAAIGAVLASIPPEWNPIVVDNGSTDDSAAIARSAGVRVVSETRRGFGAACLAGLHAATDAVVAFMDCDGSLDGADLRRVAGPVIAGDADLVLGARRPQRGAQPMRLRVANRYLASAVRRRTGVSLNDIGPMRVARRGALIDLDLLDRRFGWPLEMVLTAAAEGWRIQEVEVDYRPRVGRSKVTGTVRGTLRAARDMHAALR